MNVRVRTTVAVISSKGNWAFREMSPGSAPGPEELMVTFPAFSWAIRSVMLIFEESAIGVQTRETKVPPFVAFVEMVTLNEALAPNGIRNNSVGKDKSVVRMVIWVWCWKEKKL